MNNNYLDSRLEDAVPTIAEMLGGVSEDAVYERLLALDTSDLDPAESLDMDELCRFVKADLHEYVVIEPVGYDDEDVRFHHTLGKAVADAVYSSRVNKKRVRVVDVQTDGRYLCHDWYGGHSTVSSGDYAELRMLATRSDATQDDVNALGKWFELYDGMHDWNGEYYDADHGVEVWPVYKKIDEDDFEIISYEIR